MMKRMVLLLAAVLALGILAGSLARADEAEPESPACTENGP